MKTILSKIFNFFAKVLKVNPNKILFQSGRNKVDCAPYAIYQYLHEESNNKYRMIWIVERGTDVSALDSKDVCYYKTIKAYYHQATAKYWIRSQSLGGLLKKKKNQVYIQMWHGAGNLKKCGYDVEKRESTETMEHAKEWDFFIATDDENKKSMISSVGLKIPSIVVGNADSDIIVNASKEYKVGVLRKLGLSGNKKKILLYAPTFRDNELDNEKVDLPIQKLNQLNDWIILLRLHPLITHKLDGIELPSNFINVGWYPTINDLLLIADLLVTDYSSILFPYMIQERPLILYPYDYDTYVNLRGGFYLNYESDLPGPIVRNEEDLVDCVRNISKEFQNYSSKVKKFNEKYNSLNDGTVSERFIKLLEEGTFESK